MSSKLILAARLLLFAAVLLWTVFFLLAGFALHSPFLDFLEETMEASGGLQAALNAWFIITLIVLGVAVAYWGFRRVGKWEIQEANREEKSDEG